jgi:hypothetical protein
MLYIDTWVGTKAPSQAPGLEAQLLGAGGKRVSN